MVKQTPSEMEIPVIKTINKRLRNLSEFKTAYFYEFYSGHYMFMKTKPLINQLFSVLPFSKDLFFFLKPGVFYLYSIFKSGEGKTVRSFHDHIIFINC